MGPKTLELSVILERILF